MDHLIQIDVGYACFGIVTRNGYVAQAAPVGKWMIGRPIREVTAWVTNKRGSWTPVKSRASGPS